jgi:diguanylate cyclase (GGDEF)-like protein
MRGAWIWLFATILVGCTAVAAATDLVGSPPYATYTTDLDVYPQNFAIAQDSHGIVYVGNTNGVLEFDGERWALTPLDNREIVRSLAVDSEDRVLVGGYNAFGYLQRDAAGTAHFVDLVPHFKESLGDREFADIWNIVPTPDGVYYRALHDVFFWNPRNDETLHWQHPERFGGIVYHDGDVLLQFRGQGFRRRKGDAWAMIPSTDHLLNLVHSLLPLADGGLLLLGVDGDWLRLKNDVVTTVAMPKGVPVSSNVHAGAALSDGSIALATGDGMLYIVDPTLRFERHVRIDPGFVSQIFPTRDGGFLVSGNQSIYRVTWPTAWSVLGAEHGADGSLQRLRRWNGVDYLTSSSGAKKVIPAAGGIPGLQRMPWEEDVYDLIEIDAQRALLGGSHKLYMANADGRLSEVSPELIYPRLFLRSTFRPGRIYVGTENGLRYLDAASTGLDVSSALPDALGHGVSSLIEASTNELWMGTERHGAWRARLDDRGRIVETQRFGAEQGLQLGVVPTAVVTTIEDGAIIVSTRAGLFRFDGARFVPEELHGLASLRTPEELLKIAETSDGDIWAYGVGRLFHRPGNGEWSEQPIRGIRRGAIESHAFLDSRRIVFIATQSLLFHNGSAVDASTRAPQVQLRTVAQIDANGRSRLLPLHPDQPIHLSYGEFGVNFQFALPDLEQPRRRAYQGRLRGYEDEFSPWSASRGYTYSRLSPGEYALEVRARDGLGRISQIDPYVLIIDPPWYRTWWWYAGLAIIAALMLWMSARMLVSRRTQRLGEEKRRLESTVAERTRDLAAANRSLEAMAHLDGLTGIANRRRLDDYLQSVWTQARAQQWPVAVLAIDVDHFKRYNDSHGHLAGDQLLKDLVPRLAQCLRNGEDLLARYGGEEFVAVLPRADVQVAATIAEAMRGAVDRAGIGTSVSIGVASWIALSDDVNALVKAADLALYEAKRAGRNRIAVSASFGP